MAQIKLKRLIGKKKDATSIVRGMIESINTPLTVIDGQGQHLLGVVPAAPANKKYPIIQDDEILGWVIGEKKAAISLAKMIAFLAHKEVEQQTLATEVLDRYREINLLYNISEKLATTLQLKSVAQLAIDETNQLIEGSSAAVMLLDEQSDTLQVIAYFGSEHWEQRQIKVGQGIIGDVTLSGQAEVVNEMQTDPRFLPNSHELVSMVCAPLKTTQGIIGAIFIGSATPTTYSSSDLKLLTTLALQTAPAIENALLYEDKLKETKALEKKNTELEQLDKFKDEFLANTSHELRTPSTVSLVWLSRCSMERWGM